MRTTAFNRVGFAAIRSTPWSALSRSRVATDILATSSGTGEHLIGGAFVEHPAAGAGYGCAALLDRA